MESPREISFTETQRALEPADEIRVALRDINPENPAVAVIQEKLGRLWYKLGWVTKPKEGLVTDPPTFPSRLERANRLREVKKLRRQEPGSPDRQEYLEGSIDFHRIEREYLDQKSLTLTHPEWGALSSCYSVLNQEASLDKPPIFFVSGSSNGTESVDVLARKMAEKYPDQRIYIMGYPDAPSGEMTKEFCDAVKADTGYMPHAQYFEAAIRHLVPEGDIELWGYSGGGGIVETMLAKTPLVDRVANTALISPAGTINMSGAEFWGALTTEMALLLGNYKNLAKYIFIDDPTRGEQKEWKYGSFMGLAEKAHKALAPSLLPEIHLRKDAKMVVVSGGLDFITSSAQYFNRFNLDNLRKLVPSMEVSTILSGTHNGALMYPEKYLDAIDKKLGR